MFVEILLAHNQKSLAAQAMHELGNLQYHGGSLRWELFVRLLNELISFIYIYAAFNVLGVMFAVNYMF